MPEQFHPSHGPYIIAALITTMIGLSLSFVFLHIFRRRFADVKPFRFPVLIGHVIAYALFIYGYRAEGINDGILRAGLITLSVIPAFIIASAMGMPKKTDEREKEEGMQEGISPSGETAEPDVKQTAPAQQGRQSGFSEGMIKGLWAFVAIWVFYILYRVIFVLLVTMSHILSSPE
jgi:hypothetical protein